MDKFSLPKGQAMSDAAYIADAAKLSRELTRMKASGPGDTENAMRRIEREYGIDFGFLWSLRYRVDRLKIISHSIYLRIKATHAAEIERQTRKMAHDYQITKAAGVKSDFMDSVSALVAETNAEEVK